MTKGKYQKFIDYIYEYCNENMVKPNEISPFLDGCKIDVLKKCFVSTPGTYVLKRDGNIEKFDNEKLFNSIGSASDEIEEPLTSSDLHNVVAYVMKNINVSNVNIVKTVDIKNEVLKALSETGFYEVYRKYLSFFNDK